MKKLVCLVVLLGMCWSVSGRSETSKTIKDEKWFWSYSIGGLGGSGGDEFSSLNILFEIPGIHFPATIMNKNLLIGFIPNLAYFSNSPIKTYRLFLGPSVTFLPKELNREVFTAVRFDIGLSSFKRISGGNYTKTGIATRVNFALMVLDDNKHDYVSTSFFVELGSASSDFYYLWGVQMGLLQ